MISVRLPFLCFLPAHHPPSCVSHYLSPEMKPLSVPEDWGTRLTPPPASGVGTGHWQRKPAEGCVGAKIQLATLLSKPCTAFLGTTKKIERESPLTPGVPNSGTVYMEKLVWGKQVNFLTYSNARNKNKNNYFTLMIQCLVVLKVKRFQSIDFMAMKTDNLGEQSRDTFFFSKSFILRGKNYPEHTKLIYQLPW